MSFRSCFRMAICMHKVMCPNSLKIGHRRSSIRVSPQYYKSEPELTRELDILVLVPRFGSWGGRVRGCEVRCRRCRWFSILLWRQVRIADGLTIERTELHRCAGNPFLTKRRIIIWLRENLRARQPNLLVIPRATRQRIKQWHWIWMYRLLPRSLYSSII